MQGFPGYDGPGQESGDTLHPLGSASHVKTCNVLKRSKTYSIGGVSVNRESIQKHETACRAWREEVHSVAPVRARITGKRPPGRDYVVVIGNAVPKEGDAEEETEKRRCDGKK